MKRRKPNYRIGQQVRSSYDPKHIFTIDASVIPDRLFHEKGTDRWWLRHELRPVGAPEKAARPIVPAPPGTHSKTHPPALKEQLAGVLRKHIPKEPMPKRVCEECGAKFRPKRKWQKFHSEACRRTNWKRIHGEAA